MSAVMMAATVLGAGRASAINIVLSFDSGSSATPTFDSDGSRLTAIMEAAAAYWEDIIEDTQTINVTFYYDDLASPSIGNHNGDAYSGNVETDMTLRFDWQSSGGVATNWFFDATPLDNAEFNLQSTLYRDLAATNRVGGANAWYRGSPQEQFEVGFQGGWVGTNQGLDLFTVALHEIGHGLGLTTDNAATISQTSDSDYDLPTTLTDGATIAVMNAPSNNVAHLAPTSTLMFPSVQTGRALPSATDVLAMAAVSGWTQIDLPRKFYGGGTNFNLAGSWIGNRVPDSFDDVFILEGFNPTLSNTTFINSLAVEDGNSLNVSDEIFFAAEDVDIVSRAGNPGSIPYLSVGAGGLASVGDDLTLAGGEVRLTGGGALEIGGRLVLRDVDGRTPAIIGNGTVRVFESFSGDADFVATGNGTLEIINSGAYENLQLRREVLAFNGNIKFTDFDKVQFRDGSRLAIGAGRTATISHLEFYQHASVRPRLDLLGGAAGAAVLVAQDGEGYLNGDVTVDKAARVEGPAYWGSGAEVQLPDADDVLVLAGPTRFASAHFSGDGRLVQRGSLTVTDDATIDTFIYDWDGDSDNSTTTVSAFTTFTINSSQIDYPGATDGYDGVIFNSGTLDVNTYLLLLNPFGPPIPIADAWKLDGGGVLKMIPAYGGVPTLTGSGIEIFGTLDVFSGNSQSLSSVALETGGVINLNDPDSKFSLWGTTRLRGGVVVGPGTLVNNGDMYIDANMSIDSQGFVWSGNPSSTLTIGAGFQLLLNNSTLNAASAPYSGTMTIENGASLAVNAGTLGPWENGGLIQLNGGDTLGQYFANTVDGEVRGHGKIRGTTHINNGLLAAGNGQTLSVETNGVPDLDGTSGNGRIEAIDGDFFARRVLVFGAGNVDFHGTIEVGPGRSFAMNNSLNLFLYGELETDDGTIDVVNFSNSGVLRGSAHLLNSYVQTALGTLAIELSGTGSGMYDTFQIDQDATLAGALEISLGGGYLPSLGDSFTILDAGNVYGTFDTMLGGYIGNGLGFQVSYDEFSVVLEVVSALLPGDLNADGFVGIADLNIVLGNWNQNVGAGVWLLGDPSGDGFVGIADLNAVLGNWNAGTPPTENANIPEPGTVGVVVVLGWIVLGRRGPAC